jgi:dihydroflavonol-4-reductase
MDCTLNMIDVRDVADGLVRALERGVPGRRYLLGGENLTLIELLTMLGAQAGLAVPAVRVPYAVGLMVAYVSEAWADLVTHRPPNATVTGVRLTRRTMHFDATRSLAELGVSPRPIAQSLADTIAWLRDTEQIPPLHASTAPSPHPSSLSERV